MAGASGGRTLEETPTWAVATVCFVLIAISIVIEEIIHHIGKWLKKKHKRALFEALEKVKSELMLVGFISLLLTVGQTPIANICIPAGAAASWHPCKKSSESTPAETEDHKGRRLLSVRRILAGGGTDSCANKGKVAFVSTDGIHQLHIFIFVLAIFHVLSSVLTMALGSYKMKRWKSWEKETKTVEYQFTHDPERFRFARDTSFGRRHLRFWTKNPGLMWTVCFFRQFVRSVPKVDYLTLRHGFIMAHLAPQSETHFDFQKYIKRSLQEDFKVVVGISPIIWLVAVIFLLFNTHGWYSYLWLPFIPLVIILLVGTKLQVIITQMGQRIQDRGEVVKGVPIVEPGDDLFWFNHPRLIIYLINFVLFQNAFQLAFLAWTWYEFGLKSCFHDHLEDVIIKITTGVLIQTLCSYVTLPLYALVTQMGSTMKPTIFNEKVATALRNWHHTARKQIKQNKGGTGATPTTSAPGTPTVGMSPVHLLRNYRNELDSAEVSPRRSNFDYYDTWDSGRSRSASPHRLTNVDGSSHNQRNAGAGEGSSHGHPGDTGNVESVVPSNGIHHVVNIAMRDFSFDKRASS